MALRYVFPVCHSHKVSVGGGYRNLHRSGNLTDGRRRRISFVVALNVVLDAEHKLQALASHVSLTPIWNSCSRWLYYTQNQQKSNREKRRCTSECTPQTADKPQTCRKYLPSPVRGRGTAASAVVDEVAKKLNRHLAFLIASLFPPHQSDFV